MKKIFEKKICNFWKIISGKIFLKFDFWIRFFILNNFFSKHTKHNFNKNFFIVEKYHTVNNQNLAVKKALPKDMTSGSGPSQSRGGSMGGGRQSSRNDRFDNDYDNDFGNGNGFGGGLGLNNLNNGNGLIGNMPNLAGLGNTNLANFAMIAQKMLQAATMGNGSLGGMGAPFGDLGGFNDMGNGFNRNNLGGSKSIRLNLNLRS